MKSTIQKWIDIMVTNGIRQSHIDSMKIRILKSSSKYELIYDEVPVDDGCIPQCIDVSKIAGIATGWSTANRSVYEVFFSVTGELIIDWHGLHASRILENIESLDKNGIDFQHNFYSSVKHKHNLKDGLPEFYFYEEDDIYFSNATHRTISAIMFDAPQMIGKVKKFNKNYTKSANYQKHEKTKEQWEKFILFGLENIRVETNGSNLYVSNKIFIYQKDMPYYLFEFNNVLINPTNKNLTDTKRFEEERKTITKLIAKLKNIDKELLKVRYKKLPLVFRINVVRNHDLLFRTLLFVEERKQPVYIDIFEDTIETVILKLKIRCRENLIAMLKSTLI